MKGKNVLCYEMRKVKRYWIIERNVTLGYKRRVPGIETEGCLWDKDIDSVNIMTDWGAALRPFGIRA